MPFLLSHPRRLGSLLLACACLFIAVPGVPTPPAYAQAKTDQGKVRNFSAADIESADYTTGDLPAGQSALTAKVQILLDRSGISPGVVDGWRGGMSESALKAFQRRASLPMDGRMSPTVWQLLQPFAAGALTMDYTITEDDAHGLVDNIPSDYAEKAKMTSQGYTSILEKLSERFHMDEKFLLKLNPGIAFVPGATIKATVPAKPIRGTVTRIIIDKATRRVAAYDAKGNMIADYPATVGSTTTPSPHGVHKVDAVALNPTYTYNPNKNFKQGNNDRVLIVPPGPNGPVGDVWIDLSEPTYGIHGTATPSRLFVNQSYGCVRLTNWDARELAHMVKAKVTVVEFLEPGVSIADVTGVTAGTATAGGLATTLATTITAVRPPARPQQLAVTAGDGAAAAVPTSVPTEVPAGVAPTASASALTPLSPAGPTGSAPVVTGNDPLSEAIAQAVNTDGPVTGTVLPATTQATIPAAAPAPASTLTSAPVPGALAPTLPPRRAPRTEVAPSATPPVAAASTIAPTISNPSPAQGN